MNILIVIRWPVGGIQTYCKYIYGTPSFDLCRFTVVTTTEADEQYFRSAFGSKLVGLFRLKDKEFTVAAILRLARRVPHLQLLHAHGFSSAILSLPASVVFRIPLLLTAHDILQDSQFRGINGAMKRIALGAALGMSACINVVGRDAGENLRSYFPRVCSPRKVSILQNGIDVERFSDAKRRDLRGELGLETEVLLLGFFGRFMAQKGFRYVLDMVEILHMDPRQVQVPVHVACFGWGGFIREEQAEIGRRKLDKHFSFLPATQDMPAALRGCDAVIMPSLWEAMPLLAMEAFVAGVPLIASTCIGLREVCEGSPALMCAPADGRALLEAVKLFASSREFHEAEAQRYKVTAITRFDRKETAASLRALYTSIARSQREE